MIRMLRSRARRSTHGKAACDQRGAALVELAVALPILAVLLVGALDFGRVFRSAMVVTAAARAGALYGGFSIPHARDTGNIAAAVDNVLGSNSLSSGPSPAISLLCDCADAAGNFTPTSPPNTCSATCSGGSHIAARVSVSVTRTFTLGSSLPAFPASITLTRTAIQRVQ